MTAREEKQRLERIWKDYTSAYDTASIEDLMAFDMATNSLGAIDQIQWERDMAIKQLHDLGYGLGEKPREELNNSSQEVKKSNKEVKKANVPDTNVGDMISRQAAIDALDKRFDDIPMEQTQEILLLRRDLRTLPSAQPERQKGKWIPCSERLPENDENVLATTAWGDVTIAERVYPPINDTCWFIHDGNTNATIDDVIAWMPLPEPYGGE